MYHFFPAVFFWSFFQVFENPLLLAEHRTSLFAGFHVALQLGFRCINHGAVVNLGVVVRYISWPISDFAAVLIFQNYIYIYCIYIYIIYIYTHTVYVHYIWFLFGCLRHFRRCFPMRQRLIAAVLSLPKDSQKLLFGHWDFHGFLMFFSCSHP